MMRLQKFLAHAGLCSRRKAETYILDGRITVNSAVVCKLGTHVDPQSDQVCCDGEPVVLKQQDPKIYILVNKPKGVVTSCSHQNARIITDLVSIPERIYPVGRLDKDSIGLVLMTNDGDLHNKLSHPSFDHEKEYEVAVAKPMPDGALAAMARGLPMMGAKTRPAEIERISAVKFRMVLKEGKNRQIRRMVRKVGHHVTDLKRVRVANIRLGDLPEGAWRHLTPAERKGLLAAAGRVPGAGSGT